MKEHGGVPPRPAIWTPPFIAVTASNFLISLVFYLFIAQIAAYALSVYDVSHATAGSLVSAFVLSALVARLVFGRQIDRWGFKRSIVVGSAITAAASYLYFVDIGFAFLFLARIVHGLGFGIASTALTAAVSFVVPEERRGEGIGYYSASSALATGIGPFSASFFAHGGGGYGALLVFSALAATAALLLALFLRIPDVEPNGDLAPCNQKTPIRIGNYIQLSAVPVVSVVLIVFICYAGVVSYMSVLCEERNLVAASSLYFVVYAAVVMVSRPLVGRRIDKRGENSVAYITFAVLAFGLVLLAFAHRGSVLLLSAGFVGFGIGVAQSIVLTIIAKTTPPQELGKADSTFHMGLDLGSGVGPVALGALIPIIGYKALYLMLAVVALSACLVYHIAYGRGHAKARPRAASDKTCRIGAQDEG